MRMHFKSQRRAAPRPRGRYRDILVGVPARVGPELVRGGDQSGGDSPVVLERARARR